MHCEEARDRLLNELDHPEGPATADEALESHLQGCDDCRALRHDIVDMQTRARVWHEVSPPPWTPDGGVRAPQPGVGGPGVLSFIQHWFPVLASSAALVLAMSLYQQTGVRSADSGVAAASAAALAGGSATSELLAQSRQERQQELEALAALLKAEMDRRSLETEQSLKYIISHQIQSQQQLEALRGRIRTSEAHPAEQL